MKDKVTTRIDRAVYKQLQQLKLDLDIKTINGVIEYLVKKEVEK